MHGRFDLLTKVRARCLEEMREIVVNKICRLSRITDAKLMAVLTATKEEQISIFEKGHFGHYGCRKVIIFAAYPSLTIATNQGSLRDAFSLGRHGNFRPCRAAHLSFRAWQRGRSFYR